MKKTFLIILMVFTVFSLSSVFVLAQNNTDRDIMLVLDNSGSMRQNDPGFLTKKVVSDFVAGLPSSSQAGIVIFDEKVDLAVPLSPLTTNEGRQKITSSLSRVTFSGKLTDSPAGIERAMYELKSRGRKDATKVIIFMTDGIVDTGDKTRDVERAKWLREDLATESEKLGIRIFGIAFTDKADFQLIQALGERTGGGYFRAATADDISGIFKDIDTALKRPPAKPSKDASAGTGGNMIWIIVIVGVIVLGIVAIVVGKSKKGAKNVDDVTTSSPIKMPKAALFNIPETTGIHKIPITSPSFCIGRAKSNQMVINGPTISTHHATIEFRDKAFYLVDQRSTNGTTVNGQRITTELKLKHGDRIGFDKYEYIFDVEEFAGEEKTRLRGGSDRTVRSSAEDAVPDASDYEPPTRLKDMCPNHPSWKATEVCSICHVAYCEKCIKEKDGRKVCVKCDAAVLTK